MCSFIYSPMLWNYFCLATIRLSSSSVYSPFSYWVHNIPSPGVLMERIGAEFLRPDALPGINHMQYKNLLFYPIVE